MHSFYDFQFVIKLPIKRISCLIYKAIKIQKDNLIWDLYKSIYPVMMKEQMEFMDFETYKKKVTQEPIKYTDKTLEEVESEMDKIVATYEGR